ncbi:Aste57867_17218 [Aphanomyces stellatus]|uniref:Aste57867_17218 protein n=1 Tax=Aphanomyces stellatus TaxID=120398 RepID=A0A485L7J4_9STRA|nr:hypothetical protein As57867_017159 [Aphanomyces stellatus]VFT93975.1 Aste57867_17218 [Aphanomyces stellatus]
MAAFASAIMNIRSVAAIVLSFQHGVYTDVQPRFIEFAQNPQRHIACRPELAFVDAIETAFVCQRYNIARALMDLRTSVPQLTTRYRNQHEANPAAHVRGATVPSVAIRDNLELLTLLREFKPSE